MASSSNKTPALLSKTKTYNDRIKLLDIWTEFTQLPRRRQGPAVLFSFEDKAQQAVLETLSKEQRQNETGVVKPEKYNSLEAFETYKKGIN